jgi:hypothetical protein
MPVACLDLPSALALAVKKNLGKELAEFSHDASMIPDTRVAN